MTAAQLAVECESGPGVSDDAIALRELFSKFLSDSSQSISLEERHREARAALREVLEEASSDNWDSYGGRPADPAKGTGDRVGQSYF